MPAEIKGIVFDLDGTLIDSIECYLTAFNGALQKKQFPAITRIQLRKFLDQGFRFERMLTELGIVVDAAGAAEMRQELFSLYLEHEHEIPLLPGAIGLLADLKSSDKKLGIATGRNSSNEGRWRELKRLGIDRFLDAVVTGADAPPKPAPDTLMECARRLGLRSDECIMVGDSVVDIVAAREAGMPAIVVTTGVATHQSLSAEKPLFIFSDLIQMHPNLMRWLANGREGNII